jgi:hypothetical protein
MCVGKQDNALALGIDTIAHAAALEAGGRTLAVLASGIDQVYPERNRGLANEIMARGALISEFPTESRPIGQLLCTNLIKCMGHHFCQSLPNAANAEHSINHQE